MKKLKLILKTQPFKHQAEVLARSSHEEFFALLMEQGTGKSWVIVVTAAQLYSEHLIDLVLVLAPKGVAPGWIKQQFPEHLPESIEYAAALWKPGSRSTKANTANVKAVLKSTDKLRIIVMNSEAISATDDGLDFAIEVLDSAQSALVVIDESHRIKNPKASVTKRITNLRKRAAYRRILTGTVADKPFDVFSQFQFLSDKILGTDSFTAFKAEYAEMIPPGHGLMRHLAQRIPKVWKGNYMDEDGKPTETRIDPDGVPRKKLMEPRYLPQIVATDANGRPKYKNLDKLHALIEPHSFRVLKVDCLDLPKKLYNRYYTELSAEQWHLYKQARDLHRIEWEEGRITAFNKLTVYLRLQQIICGYIPTGLEEGRLHELFPSWSANPRIVSTLEYLADRPPTEHTIIWCRFIEDIKRLTEALKTSYGATSVVQFYGGVNDGDRTKAVERFEGERIKLGKSGNVISRDRVPDNERARFMLAQQRAGGVGQTWVSAGVSFHYSNAFSLIDRLQAEDRPHRIGQTKTVNYIDLEAEDTIDTIIIDSLVNKKEVADVINGDKTSAWLR